MAKKFLALLLAAVCMVSVVATSNPVEVSAKDKYKKGDYITFGSYEQDGNKENGAEPIEWEILDVKNGKLLVISRYILDVKRYNEKVKFVTWETCTLRKWLNKDFYNSAFKAGEKKKIVKTKISNPDNKLYGTDGGKNTKDRIFCLSVDEILKYYRFNTYSEDYFCGYCQDLIVSPTAYALKRGVFARDIDEDYYKTRLKEIGYTKDCIGRGGGRWWLRSPGSLSFYACRVIDDGHAGASDYNNVDSASVGVRPALYIEY